jgi:hypothetical protein
MVISRGDAMGSEDEISEKERLPLRAAYIEAVEELEQLGVDRGEAEAQTGSRLVIPFARGNLTAFYLTPEGEKCEFPISAWQEPEKAVAIFDQPKLASSFEIFPEAAVGRTPYVHRHLFEAWLTSFLTPISLRSSEKVRPSNGSISVPDAPPIRKQDDPRLYHVWTFPMSLAWLAWGDPDKVALYTPRMASFFGRPMIGDFDQLHEKFVASRSISELHFALIDALRKGQVTATGVRHADGAGISIPASEWSGLAFVVGSDDVAGYDGASQPTYTHVRLSSALLLNAFPAAVEGPPVLALSISRQPRSRRPSPQSRASEAWMDANGYQGRPELSNRAIADKVAEFVRTNASKHPLVKDIDEKTVRNFFRRTSSAKS